MSDPIVQAIALRYRYPGAEAVSAAVSGQRPEALADFSLEVRPGEKLALLGANGSGKSTLLLHLNGTLRAASGEVRFEGRPFGSSRAEIAWLRRHVALVFQDPDDQLFAPTLAQDVSFGPMNLGMAPAEVKARVEEALAAVDLAPLADLPIHMLSFGQRKRAALAGALALRPRVLLLDEPTAGLDPEGVQRLLEYLDRRIKEGLTVLFSTHDVDLALSWADRAAVMAQGRLLACGAPAQVLGRREILQAARLRMPALLSVAAAIREAFPGMADEFAKNLLARAASGADPV